MTEKYFYDCEVIHEEAVKDVRSKMKNKDDYVQLASLFKMFADGTRVQILHALEQNEMCVCDLAILLGVTKSAISHQLKALRLANLVKFRREGQIVYYSLADDHVKAIIDIGFVEKSEQSEKVLTNFRFRVNIQTAKLPRDVFHRFGGAFC